ncbi:MAG: Stp1/IreP family PP2C-type Ser/Thr phosphatase [Firmicutes bacterium]|nr:Stp1/IreP family PP2C-type Ser/Thr phosphatase [Bacillota bacterium]
MRIGASTCTGKVRTLNEDAFWYDERCFVVCDGMGGHQAGEVASAMAVDTIKRYQFKCEDPVEEIKYAISLAHQKIYQASREKPELSGMGTTLTMGLICKQDEHLVLKIGHVGDSRAYLFRNQELSQLTKDHSVVEELMRNGGLTKKEAAVHPQRNVLTQALGLGEIEIDIIDCPIQSGDRIMLCTDGLSNLVDDQQLIEGLIKENPQETADFLVELANSLDGRDNITVLIVDFP